MNSMFSDNLFENRQRNISNNISAFIKRQAGFYRPWCKRPRSWRAGVRKPSAEGSFFSCCSFWVRLNTDLTKSPPLISLHRTTVYLFRCANPDVIALFLSLSLSKCNPFSKSPLSASRPFSAHSRRLTKMAIPCDRLHLLDFVPPLR